MLDGYKQFLEVERPVTTGHDSDFYSVPITNPMSYQSKEEEKTAIPSHLLVWGAVTVILIAIGLFFFQNARSNGLKPETVAIPPRAQQALENRGNERVPKEPLQLPPPPAGPPPGALIQPQPKK